MVLQAAISQAAPAASSFASSAGGAGLSAANAMSAGMGLTNMFANMAFNASQNHRAYIHQRNLLKKQAQLNFDYSTRFAEEQGLRQYTRTREALEAANFNPLLAIQGANTSVAGGTGFTSASGSPAASVDSNALNAGVQAGNAMQMAELQKQNMAMNTRLQRSQGELAMAQQDKVDAETSNINEDTLTKNITNQYLPKTMKNTIRNIIADTDLKRAQAYQSVSNADSMRLMAQNDTGRTGALIDNLYKQGLVNTEQSKLLHSMNKYYGAKAVSDIINSSLGTIFQGVSAFKGTPNMPYSSQSYNYNTSDY